MILLQNILKSRLEFFYFFNLMKKFVKSSQKVSGLGSLQKCNYDLEVETGL